MKKILLHYWWDVSEEELVNYLLTNYNDILDIDFYYWWNFNSKLIKPGEYERKWYWELNNYYDLIICIWFLWLEKIIKIDFKNIYIIDFHMLANFNLKRNEYTKIINENNIKILSCFPKFHYLYHNFWIKEDSIIDVYRFIDYDYINSLSFEKMVEITKDKSKLLYDDESYVNRGGFNIYDFYESKIINVNTNEAIEFTSIIDNYILCPWNHKRDYELFLLSLTKIDEKLNILIIDSWLDIEEIGSLIKKYNVKNQIFFIKWVVYTNFLYYIFKSQFVVLPLINEKNICNGLTLYSLILSIWKLLIINTNLTIYPFVENWSNCIMTKNTAEDFAKWITYANNNTKVIKVFEKKAKKYASDKLDLKNLINEFII